MSESGDSVNVDKLGQAAYAGQLAVVTDALTTDDQLAHVADSVSNKAISWISPITGLKI